MNPELKRYRIEQSVIYFKRIRGMRKRMISLEAALERLAADMTSLRAIDYSCEKVSMTQRQRDLSRVIDRVDEALSEYSASKLLLLGEIEGAKRALDAMPDQSLAALLELYYLADVSWAECEKKFGYTKSGILYRRDQALLQFYDYIPQARKQ